MLTASGIRAADLGPPANHPRYISFIEDLVLALMVRGSMLRQMDEQPDVASALMANYGSGFYFLCFCSLCLFLHILGRCRQALSGSQWAGTCIAGCAYTSLPVHNIELQFTIYGLHSKTKSGKSIQSPSGTLRHFQAHKL